jgi:asparagine synthase (glutamine-hydrolysing)
VDGLTQDLLAMYDVESARRGVDQRYPFFDLRLIELCSEIPLPQRLGDGWTRRILRRSMSGILPAEVSSRVDKGNIGAGIRHKLSQQLPTVARVARHPDVVTDYVDVRAFRAAHERFASNPMRAPESDIFTLFLSCSLALWLEGGDAGQSARPTA